jgi:hypothetical protein
MRRVAVDRPSDALVARLRNSVNFSFNSSLFNCLMATVFLWKTNSSLMIFNLIILNFNRIKTGLKLSELLLRKDYEELKKYDFSSQCSGSGSLGLRIRIP